MRWVLRMKRETDRAEMATVLAAVLLDPPAVIGAESERLQDQQVEGTLQVFGLGHADSSRVTRGNYQLPGNMSTASPELAAAERWSPGP